MIFGSGFQLRPADPVPAAYPVHTKIGAHDGLVVSIPELREFLGLADADPARDAELLSFIRAAQVHIEDYCQLSLFNTTWRAEYPFFSERMPLRRRPFSSVTSVEYTRDDDGEVVTVATDTYAAILSGQQMAFVYEAASKSWPSDAADRHNAVRITFVAGYGTDADAIPFDIKHAIKMTVAKMDSKRGDECGEGGGGYAAGSVFAQRNQVFSIIPNEAEALLSQYRYRHLAVA